MCCCCSWCSRLGTHPLAPFWCPACVCLQVARALLRGVEAGQYHLPSPDLGQNLLVAGMTSLRWATVCGKHRVGLVGA